MELNGNEENVRLWGSYTQMKFVGIYITAWLMWLGVFDKRAWPRIVVQGRAISYD